MRGFHVMMRSLPALQERNREVHVVIVEEMMCVTRQQDNS